MPAITVLASKIKGLMDADIASITEAKTSQLAANAAWSEESITAINAHTTAHGNEKASLKDARTAQVADFDEHYLTQIALLENNSDAALNSVQEVKAESVEKRDELQTNLDHNKKTLESRIAAKIADFGAMGEFVTTVNSSYTVIGEVGGAA